MAKKISDDMTNISRAVDIGHFTHNAGNWPGEDPYETEMEVYLIDTFPTNACQNVAITPANLATVLDCAFDVDGDNILGVIGGIDALQTITNIN